MFDLNKSWNKETIIAFDTETTGKYPLESEICEIAAVKWQNGQIVDKFQQLIKPSSKMSDEVIQIHHITNEMVESSPSISNVIKQFADFIKEAYLVAHHAPFDLGFLAIEFEKQNISFPEHPVLCSSLLSRKIFPSSPNHRLQTLLGYLNLEKGQAHRALDDSIACLNVTLKCFEKLGPEITIGDIFKIQLKKLNWLDYSIQDLHKKEPWKNIIEAIHRKSNLFMTYQGGSKPGTEREVCPKGIVRSPNGDFLVAMAQGEKIAKRYFLDKITAARL